MRSEYHLFLWLIAMRCHYPWPVLASDGKVDQEARQELKPFLPWGVS